MGSNMTPDGVQKKVPFCQGGLAACNLLCDMLNNLAHLELGSSTVDSLAAQLRRQGNLPFLDVYPCAAKSHGDLDAALTLQRRYLQATKPVLIFGLGVLGLQCRVFEFPEWCGLEEQSAG